MNLLSTLLTIEIIRWIVILGEGYLAKRIYNIIVLNDEYRQGLTQLRLLVGSELPSSEPLTMTQTQKARAFGSSSLAIRAWLTIRGQVPTYQKIAWPRLALGTCLGSAFLLVFLVTLYVLRSVTFRWVLSVIPLLIPLILLPIPYLLRVQPPIALFLLGLGIGVGLLLLLIPGI